MKEKESEIVDIDLTKKEIDKLEETIASLRDYGFAHIELDNKLLIFQCDELVENYEEFESFLLKSGLSPEEVRKHMEDINKK